MYGPFITLFLRLAIFAVLLLVVFLSAVFLPYDRQYAYNQLLSNCDKGNWMYSRIFLNPTPIDIAFLGTSRTDSGIRDSLLEAIVNQNRDTALHVANFGFCRFGRTLDYLILKDILKKHRPKIVVLEAHPVQTRFSHDDFPCIADTRELLTVKYHPQYLRQLVKGIMFRLHYHFAVVDKKRPYADEADKTYLFRAHKVKEKAALEQKLKIRQKKKAKETTGLKQKRIDYSSEYVRRIAALADAYGFELKIMYMPGTCTDFPDEPKEAAFYRSLGELWLPPRAVFETPEHCADVDHLTEPGANMLTQWVGEKLSR